MRIQCRGKEKKGGHVTCYEIRHDLRPKKVWAAEPAELGVISSVRPCREQSYRFT